MELRTSSYVSRPRRPAGLRRARSPTRSIDSRAPPGSASKCSFPISRDAGTASRGLDTKPTSEQQHRDVPRSTARAPRGRYPRALELLHAPARRRTFDQDASWSARRDVDEVVEVLRDLRRATARSVTIGQYLRPSLAHLPMDATTRRTSSANSKHRVRTWFGHWSRGRSCGVRITRTRRRFVRKNHSFRGSALRCTQAPERRGAEFRSSGWRQLDSHRPTIHQRSPRRSRP